eukprot:c45677_g1_i1 orf=260-568(-)
MNSTTHKEKSCIHDSISESQSLEAHEHQSHSPPTIERKIVETYLIEHRHFQTTPLSFYNEKADLSFLFIHVLLLVFEFWRINHIRCNLEGCIVFPSPVRCKC